MLLARATGTFSARSARVRSTLWRGERGARGRHTLGRGEHLRLLAKQAAGCSFFVTQIIYDVNAAKNLVSDYHYECAARDVKPAPTVFTFSVCGSLNTLEFVQWLGVDVPHWIENELRHADNTLDASYDHAVATAVELIAFCRRVGVPFGLSVALAQATARRAMRDVLARLDRAAERIHRSADGDVREQPAFAPVKGAKLAAAVTARLKR